MPSSSHPSRAKIQEEWETLLPRITLAQRRSFAEMVYVMLLVDSCGLTRLCSFLSSLFGKPMNTLRQKYRELSYEKEAKAGVKHRGASDGRSSSKSTLPICCVGLFVTGTDANA